MDIDASSLLALEMAPPAETLPHPAVEFEAADDGGATSKALALQRSSEIEKVFAQFTREILNPLTQLSKIPLLATSEPERYGDSPSQPPLCRASMLEQKSRSPCLRLHRDLRSRARATQKIQVSTCHIGYFLFVAPVGTSSTFFGFIEGGRAFKDKPADLSLIEPLLRVLRRNRPATDTSALRESFMATPVVAAQETDLVVKMVESLSGILVRDLTASVSRQTSVTHPSIVKAIDYTRLHLSEPLNISVIARTAGVSENYFSKLFKRTTGLTFSDYLIRQRIKKAEELLMTTSRNINEIAYAVGFESISHFNRSFKAHTKTAPRSYRELLHKIQAAPEA